MHTYASFLCGAVVAAIVILLILAARPATCADIAAAGDKLKAYMPAPAKAEGYEGPNYGLLPSDYGVAPFQAPGCGSALQKDYACNQRCLYSPGNNTYANCMSDCLVPQQNTAATPAVTNPSIFGDGLLA